MRKISMGLAILGLFLGGCVLDTGNEESKKDEVTGIDQLTMGGGIFIFREQGFGMAQVGVFHGDDIYEDASIFVNGKKLANNMGIHSNAEPMVLDDIPPGSTLRIAVYALGDSVVHELTVPEDPIIVKPEEGTVVALGDSMDIEIAFPGKHKYIAFTLIDHGISFVNETDLSLVKLTIPGGKMVKTGKFPLNAYSINTSGRFPDVEGFDINKQYEVFLVAAVTVRNVEFRSAE